MDLPPRRLGQRAPQKAPPPPVEAPPGRLGPGIGGALSGSSVNDFLARAALRNGGRGSGGVSESEQSGWSESDIDNGGSWAPSGGFGGPSAGSRRTSSGSRGGGGNTSGFAAPSLDSHNNPEPARTTTSLETAGSVSQTAASMGLGPGQPASEDTSPRPTSARDRGAGFARSAAALLASPDKAAAADRDAQPYLTTPSPRKGDKVGESSSGRRRRSSGGNGGEGFIENGLQIDALDAAALAEESPRKQPASTATPVPTAAASPGPSPRRQPSASPRREPSPSPRRESSSSSKREPSPSPRREPSPRRRPPSSVRPPVNPQLAASAPAPFTAAMLGVEEPSSTETAVAAAKQEDEAAPVRVATAWCARNDDSKASSLNGVASRNRSLAAAGEPVTDGDSSAAAAAESKPCDQFRVDLTAATFGVCKCGHEKSVHQKSAQSASSSGSGSRSKGAKSGRSEKDKKAEARRAAVPPPPAEPPQASPRTAAAANGAPLDSEEAPHSRARSVLPEPKNDDKPTEGSTVKGSSSSSQRIVEVGASNNTDLIIDAPSFGEKQQLAPASAQSPMLRAPPKLSPLKLRDHATVYQGPQMMSEVGSSASKRGEARNEVETATPAPQMQVQEEWQSPAKASVFKGDEVIFSSKTSAGGFSDHSAGTATVEWDHQPQQNLNLAPAITSSETTKFSSKIDSQGRVSASTTTAAPRMSGSGWLDASAAAARAEAKAAEHERNGEGEAEDGTSTTVVSPFKAPTSTLQSLQERSQHDSSVAPVAAQVAETAAPLPQSQEKNEALETTGVEAEGGCSNNNALSAQVPPLDYGHSLATQPATAHTLVETIAPSPAPAQAPVQTSVPVSVAPAPCVKASDAAVAPAATVAASALRKPEVPVIAPQGRLRARVTTQMGVDDSAISSEKAPLSRVGQRRHSLSAAPQMPNGFNGPSNAAAAVPPLPLSSSTAGTDPDSDAFWNRLQDDEDRDVVSALNDSENPGAFELFGGGRAHLSYHGGGGGSGRSSSGHTSEVSPMKPHNHATSGGAGGGTWKASKAFGRRGSRYDSGGNDHNDNHGGMMGGGSLALASKLFIGQRLGTARTSDDETGADTENEHSPAKSVRRPHGLGSRGPAVINVDLEATPASRRTTEALQAAMAKASTCSNNNLTPTGDVLADSLAAHAASEAASATALEVSTAQAALEVEMDQEEVPGEGSGSLAAACGLPLPAPERRWLLRPLNPSKGQARAEVRRNRGTGELLFFLQGVGNSNEQGHAREHGSSSGDDVPSTASTSSSSSAGTFVLGARPGKGNQKGELLISLADAFGQQRGNSSNNSNSAANGPVVALRPENTTGNGWSMQYLGSSGGEVGACLLSAGISPDGGKTKVPRVGCVALPLFQRSTEAATTTTQSGSSVSDANTATSTASSAVPRRLCVWRDHTSKKGSSSAMLASVARGDMVAMLLLRAASPQWVNHPDGSNLHSHLNGTSSSGATAEGSSGRYEIPSWPIGNGGAPLAGANTEPSRKTLVFLDPTTSSGSNDNVRNAAPHRAVFALARVSGERDTFAVTFAAPLSPLHAFAAACVAIGSNAKGADVALAGAPWPTGASGSASAHSSNMTGTTSSSNSSNVMSTPRGAAMAALGAAGLVLPQRKVLPPLAAGSAVPPPAAAPPEAPQTPGKGPGVAEEGEAASMDSPATAHSRQELLQQHQRGSEHHEANERGSEAAAVEVVARGRVIKRRSISQLRDSRDGSHDSYNGSAGYNGPLLGSPGHYPQGSLAAKLMPFSPMAAAASHIAESALTAGLDYFTDMPLGYPPTNDLPAMADSTNYEDTDRSARGSAGKHGDSQFRSSYRHDDDDDGKAWHEEGPEPRLGDELYGGADDDDEEEGGIHSGRVSSSMQLDAHAPRLTQGGDSPSSIGAASRSTSGPWTDESNLRRNNNGDEDAHRLKQAARWYGFQFLCKSGWQHENAQLSDAGVVGSVVYFGLAMVAELYPSGPTYQLALATILFYLHAFDDNNPSVLFLRRRDRRHQESVLLNPEATSDTNEETELELATKHALMERSRQNRTQSRSSSSASRPVFVPALAWRGPVEGFVFKLGILGLGYYQDSASVTSAAIPNNGDANTPREKDGSRRRSGSENGSDEAQSPLHRSKIEIDNNSGHHNRLTHSNMEESALSVAAKGEVEGKGMTSHEGEEESVFGGILMLHAPNGALWWSLACAIVITVAGDLDFLSSSETRVSVGWRGLEDGVRRSDKALAIRRIVFVATAIALPLKVGLFYAAAQRHARGRRVMRRLIGQLDPFLPPRASMPTKPAKLALVTEARLVALAWLHGVVAAVLLCLGIIAVTVLSDASQTYGFGASRAGNLPLTALFFLKGATTLAVFGVLAAEMQLAQCVGRFGCLLMVWRSARPPKALRSARARRHQGALPLTPTTLRGLAAAKALDLLGAVFFGAALVEQSSAFAANGGIVTDASAVACFRLAVGCAAVGDALGTVLVASALWFLANLLTREDRWDGEFSDSESDSGSDSNSDSSDDDSSNSSDRSDDDYHDNNDSGLDDSDAHESTDDDDDDDDASTDSEDYGSDYDNHQRKQRRSKQGRRSSKAQSKSASKKKKKKSVSYDGIPVPDLDDGFDDFIFSFDDVPLGTARDSEGGAAPRGSVSKATKGRRGRNRQHQGSPTEGYDYQMQAASDPYRTTAPSPQEQLTWQRQRASIELAHAQGRSSVPPPPLQMMSPQQSQQQLGFVPPPPPLPPQMLDRTYGDPNSSEAVPGHAQGNGDGDWWWDEMSNQWVSSGTGDGGDHAAAEEQGGYWDEEGNWVEGWWDEQGQWVTSSTGSWDPNAVWSSSSGNWAENEKDGGYGNVTESSWPSPSAAAGTTSSTTNGGVSPVPPPPLTARDAIRARAIAAAGGTAAAHPAAGSSSSTKTPLRAPSLSRNSTVTTAGRRSPPLPNDTLQGMSTPQQLSPRTSGAQANRSGSSNSGGGARSSGRPSPPPFRMGKAAFRELWESWGDGSNSGSKEENSSTSGLSQEIAVQTLSTSLAGPAGAAGASSSSEKGPRGSWLSAEAVSDHLTARGFSVVSSMHSGGALRIHATAKGLPSSTDTSSMARSPEGATFLLEMLFSGPGFDGQGAVFAEGKNGEGKDEGDFLEMTFKCDDANELPTFVKKLNLNRLVATR